MLEVFGVLEFVLWCLKHFNASRIIIQDGWKGRIDILKSLKENTKLFEDRKSGIFFKVSYAINELEGPPLINGSTLISPDELEVKLSKLKDKWARKFDYLSYFF